MSLLVKDSDLAICALHKLNATQRVVEGSRIHWGIKLPVALTCRGNTTRFGLP